VIPPPPADLPPLPRSSIVAVLAHRGELGLEDAQVDALDRADAELQVQLTRLRAEGGMVPPAEPRPGTPPGMGPPAGMGQPTGGPGTGGPGGGRAPGMGMSSGPGGFQLSPSGGGMGGGMGGGAGHGGAAGAAPGAPPRRDSARAREALEARLDDADTRAFLKIESVLTPAQRERAREVASRYREQLFERREQLFERREQQRGR
jgi:hypothetical protein